MEIKETIQKQNNLARAFQKEELSEYINDIIEIPCSILEGGLKEVNDKFVICECDPERCNPICLDCFKKCHYNGLKYPHKEIETKLMNAVCICGFKCHQPLNEKKKQDKQYKLSCTFGELATIPDLNFSYQDVESSNANICLLCYNICYEAPEKLIKHSHGDLKGFKCSCKSNNHSDIKIIFRKLRLLAKKNNFIKKYNFEGLSFIQFLNILFKAKTSFKNLFHSFITQIQETYKNLDNNEYMFEDHNRLNDLHLTSQVLLVFSQKCKNEYKIKNRIIRGIKDNDSDGDEKLYEESEDELVDKESVDSSDLLNNKSLGIKGGRIDFITVQLRSLCYFNDVINEILDEKIYFKIMQRKFDYKSRNIWQLKYYLTSIFHKYYILKDFAPYPNLKPQDIILLSPLQRALVVSSIEYEHKMNKYVNNLNFNYLNNILLSIEAIINSPEKPVSCYLILAKLLKISLLFAKFSLFNHEQVIKLCSLNNSILCGFDEEKPNLEVDFLKLKVISPMLKTLLILGFYFNDQLVISALKGEKIIDQIQFYHGKTEINKNICANIALMMIFLNRFNDTAIREQKDLKKMKIKKKEENDIDIKFKDNLPPKQHYIKCYNNVCRNIQTILNLSLFSDEEYNSGLTRLIDNDQHILFKYIINDLSMNEKEYLQRIRFFTEKLEDNYFVYFSNINSPQNEEKFTQKYEDIITEFLRNFVPIHYLDKNRKDEDEEENSMLKNDNESENEKKEENNKKSKKDFRDTANNNNKYLVLKTFFLQSIIKYIHSMYLSHYSKKNPPEKFFVKPQVFKKIMEVFYNFIYNCPENSFFILQSDFTTNLQLLNDEQLLQAISLINTALQNIAKSKRDLINGVNLLHFLKVVILKSSKNAIIGEILKTMRTLALSVNCFSVLNINIKILKLLKIIFNYHTIIKNYFTLMTSSKKEERIMASKKETEKIVKKFMIVLNSIINQRKYQEEKEFLNLIISREQITNLLYTKTINISLRCELLDFYRKCFLEIILDKKDITYFTSLLINDFQLDKKDEIIENPKHHKFLEMLIKSSDNSGEILLEKDANVIKFELLNFQEVLTITTERDKMRKYIDSIVKCVVVYFTKFSSSSFELNGFNCLSLYEIIYYFLKLKKYIYSQRESLRPPANEATKILFKRKFMSKFPAKFLLINPENSSIEGHEGRERKDFAKRFLVKEKKKIKLPKNDLEAVEFDLAMLEDENYDFLNFTKLRNIFKKHTDDFVRFRDFKNVKDFFEKSYAVSAEKKEKYKKYLKSIGRLNNNYEYTILKIIAYYMNSKVDIEHGSFIKQLSETNAHYNITYRMILCKTIPYFMVANEGRFKDDVRWTLFKLLQYDTSEVQQVFIDLEEENKENEPIFDFNKLMDDFTSNIMTVILREINNSGYENRREYIEACLNIKIMKFFCEEHNAHFQSFFFNNTTSILNPQKDVIVKYRRLKLRNKNLKKNESNPLLLSGQKGKRKLRYSFQNSLQDRKYDEKKASVFEYLLQVLGKILLLSNWINNRADELDDYFYDIYFIILEFLIETIQGTTRENLNKIFVGEKKSKRFFERFLVDINPMLIDDSSNAPLNYIIRKDMIDFIMAFLEESATPSNGIVEISSVILPATILESIIATMNKLYEDQNEEECKDDNEKDNNKKDGDKKNAKKFHKDEKLIDKEDRVYIKRNYVFTPEMKKHFKYLYFNNSEFGEDGKFALANRMYQYFKMLGQSTSYKNSYVAELYFKLDMFSIEQVTRAYYNKSYKLINKVTNAAITDDKFNDQFLCVTFFESITRTVFVQKEGEKEQVSIIFTINPVVPLLSKISKDDFIDNVDRSDRYTKLVSLLERCDNFYEEIKYRETSGNANCILKFINDINFYILEVIAFVITVVINLLMLGTLDGEGDALYGDQVLNNIIRNLGYLNLCLNLISLILWLIAKFKLLYMTECQIMIKNYEEQNIEEGKIIVLTLSDKFSAAFNVLIRKNKLLPFIWNIILSFVGAYKEIYIIYIIQLFIILNLSSTLRNLVSAIALRGGQLISVFYFSVVVNLCLAAVAFFYFEEDFIKAIDSKMPHDYPSSFNFLNDLIGGSYIEPSHQESECGTFAYCLMTHLDYGMRFDGGIADRMSRRSYNYNQIMYISRFVYEMIYFWSQTVMLQGMMFSIVIEAFSELRNKELEIEKDKNEICFVCGIDKASCEKNGQKFEEHISKEHNLWTYVDYILGLRFVDIQDTNAINSYVMERIQRKELVWLPMYIKKEEEKGED